MDNGHGNGNGNEAPPKDVDNTENGKPTVRFEEKDVMPQLRTPSPSGPSTQEMAAIQTIQTTKQPLRRWSWGQILLGKRDAAQGFRGLGWKMAPFIFLSELGERTSYFGLQINIIFYFVRKLNMPLATAATLATNFFGASSLTPLAGAFIADAFLGRFLTGAIGCIFYVACVGSGGIRPTTAPFGADQFDRSNKMHESQLRHYFNWYYMSVGIAMVVASTFIVYLQDKFGFGLAGLVCVILMAMGSIAFVAGAPFYIYLPPLGSPLTKMAQVFVAAVRKRKYALPKNPNNLYKGGKLDDKENLAVRQELLDHTTNFRFLDKAAILEDVAEEPDTIRRYHPWRLATVNQVEELKILLRILPVWLTTIPVSLVIIQSATFFNQQAATMNRHFGFIIIPPASMLVFSVLAIVVCLPIYDLVIIRILRKFTGNPNGLSYLQRIGVGIFFTILTMICAASVEKKRRHVADVSGKGLEPLGRETLRMSAMWLIPQNVLAGLTEMFVVIGLLDFFYNEAPESIRSMSNAIFWLSIGLGSFLSSIFVATVQWFTRNDCDHPASPTVPPKCGWFRSNTSLGHLDYFYWLLGGVAFINFLGYLIISHWFIYKNSKVENIQLDQPNSHLDNAVDEYSWSIGPSDSEEKGTSF